MRSAGTVPQTAMDLSDLSALTGRAGPFLTAYVVTDGAVENAAIRSEQRWKTLRGRLADDGAPPSAVDLVDPLVANAHLRGAALAVVTDSDEVLLTEHLDVPLDEDRGRWGHLPDLGPLLRWRQTRIPYVTVLADRGGADLTAFHPDGRAIERTTGEGTPERKVHPGGWSQPRFQQRAENDWKATAADVASEVARLSRAVDARVVVLGGDVRATQMIRDDLPTELDDAVHLIDQGRAADGSDEAREREIRRLLATAVAEDTVALLERFKEEHGQHDRAVSGAAATVDALNRAAVDVLLVHDGEQERTAWIGADPVPISLQREEAVAEDAALAEAPLVDVLVRAAIGTGASVRVIPEAGPVPEGVGALLRWAEPAP